MPLTEEQERMLLKGLRKAKRKAEHMKGFENWTRKWPRKCAFKFWGVKLTDAEIDALLRKAGITQAPPSRNSPL